MKRRFFLIGLIFIIGASAFCLDPVEMFGKPWEELAREQRRAFWRKRTYLEYEPSGKPTIEHIDHYIQIFKDKNIFDPKVLVFAVKAENRGGTITLTGEVLFPNHKTGVERVLGILGFEKIENLIRILPDSALGERGFAVATAPVVSLNRNPGEHSEQLNQVVKGDPLRLLKPDETGAFFLIQTPDAYIGWVDGKDITRMTLKEWSALRKSKKSYEESRRKIMSIARPLMGVKYVWGGITEEGVDCSGLTQYIYKKVGIYLPRDADEQSNVGMLVGFPGYLDNLRPGDLLFFHGRTGRISHVAISLGGGDLLQSTHSEGVHEASIDPESPKYQERIAERIITARRVVEDGF